MALFTHMTSTAAEFQKSKAGKTVGSGRIIKENLEEMFKGRRSTLLILPAISRQVLETARYFPGCIVAGGAALELYTGDVNKIKDWDLFFSGPDSYRAALGKFKAMGFAMTNKSDWSLTLEKSGVIVQLIHHRFPQTIGQVFDRFDFTVCCFAIKGDDIYYTEQAAVDVEAKQLNFIYTDNIIAAIKRVARYGQKGYMPTTQCVKDLLEYADDIPDDGPAAS